MGNMGNMNNTNNMSIRSAKRDQDMFKELDAVHQRAILLVKEIVAKREKAECSRSTTLSALRASVKSLLLQEIESIKELAVEMIDASKSQPATTGDGDAYKVAEPVDTVIDSVFGEDDDDAYKSV